MDIRVIFGLSWIQSCCSREPCVCVWPRLWGVKSPACRFLEVGLLGQGQIPVEFAGSGPVFSVGLHHCAFPQQPGAFSRWELHAVAIPSLLPEQGSVSPVLRAASRTSFLASLAPSLAAVDCGFF